MTKISNCCGAHEAEIAHEAVIGYVDAVTSVVPVSVNGAHDALTAKEDVDAYEDEIDGADGAYDADKAYDALVFTELPWPV